MAGEKKKKGPKIFKTVVRQEEVILPGETTMLTQSTRITNAKFVDFNLLVAKTFVHLIYQLQPGIKVDMSGKDWRQISLFELNKSNCITVPVVLSKIVDRGNYIGVIEALKKLRQTSFVIKSPYKEGLMNYTGIIDSFDAPVNVNNKSTVYVYLREDIVDSFIKVNSSNATKIGQHTKYLYEVVMNSTCKYTWKIYQFICSWKSKGGTRISYQDFRDLLGIQKSEYKTFSLFKRDVLQRCQDDLYKKADCWFNCSENGFVEREGKKVMYLNFKIIVPVLTDDYKIQCDNIREMCKHHFKFAESHINSLNRIFETGVSFESIRAKIFSVSQHIEKNKDKVNDPASYLLSSLNAEFLD